MKRLIYMLGLGLLLMITVEACKETEVGTIVKDDKQAPGPLSNAVVENLNGAAKITFSLPGDKDLLYVRAVYTNKRGVVWETKVSRYLNNLTLEGFGDSDVYEAKLYAVDKSENESVPLIVKVHPKTPPFVLVKDRLKPSSVFGGISVDYENESEANIAIIVLANDRLGNFVPIRTFNTRSKTGDFSARDLPSVDTKFGLFVRDRWGNLSDTTYVTLKPLFEVKLDKSKMKGLILPTDARVFPGNSIDALFNDDVSNNTYYHSTDADGIPQWFSYDMGQTVKLSRLSWFMRQGWYFMLHNPRNVEIWGSNNPPTDGSYNNWVLLTTHEQIKPSGLPYGQNSNADIEAANLGETVLFPIEAPAVRYIRFKTLRNWSDGSYVNFTEITMWGNPQ